MSNNFNLGASCEIDLPTIVLRGKFNPAIVQPVWLAAKGLIREAESTDTKVEKIADTVSDYDIGWVHVQVMEDRFQAIGKEAGTAGPLVDLVTGVFTILEHTPIRSLGMNRTMHFRLQGSDTDRWHRIGDRLAPKEPWNGLLVKPGMLAVAMQGKIASRQEAVCNVRVEPSARVSPGVFVTVNEHHDFPDSSAGRVMEALRTFWQDAQMNAKRVAEGLLGESVGGAE